MRARSRRSVLLAASVAAAALAWAGTSVRADATSSGVAVARVGVQTITAREVERRIAQVPPFQVQTFGKTPDEIRRSFLERVLVREVLLSEGAQAGELAGRADVQDRVRAVLRSAMLQRVRAETAATDPVTDGEVRAYYEANRDKFSSPPRIAIWRILVDKAEAAQAIVDELRTDLSPKRWNALARERSLDKTTSLRSGNLGFVTPEGATAEPEVKIDPRVVAAAATVKDGEIVGAPVPEGDRFAVVWRRQSMKAVNRSLDQEAASIRQALSHRKAEARVKELLEKLRTEHLVDYAPDRVDLIDITPSGDLQPVRRPGTLPSSRRAAASPAPHGGHMR